MSAKAVAADPRWAAVLARDPKADGRFVYAVRTTGVFCRPSCAARTPRRENVEMFDTTSAAERAGYRACKRCDPKGGGPDARRAEIVARLCRFIESSDEPPTLEQLAAHAGMSPHHVHRMFKAVTGVTPKAYARAHREERVRARLERGAPVTQAIYEAGYSSSGRFYERSNDMLGMTPSKYRNGGTDVQIRFAIGECSLGSVLVAATARGVCSVLLGDDPNELAHDLERRFPKAQLVGADRGFEKLVAQVVGLVERPGTNVDLPLDVRGTAFQRRVWQALQSIPPGTTASYSKIAESIGAPRASRAVARACAENPVAVAIPCHRVVRTDGDLSGYRWGVERKRALLARESA